MGSKVDSLLGIWPPGKHQYLWCSVFEIDTEYIFPSCRLVKELMEWSALNGTVKRDIMKPVGRYARNNVHLVSKLMDTDLQ
ncbi:hypothetical protein R1sor_024932 [Riccia sorocarpa]|uniref:Uncharacterized protein n=1 Tax=Riccia sorocarpa TaxID=122646 RepID=A0ABD3GTS6_9MARC